MHDELGNRMKTNYEFPARRHLTRRIPVIVRVHGRSFHTFTRGFDKSFDSSLMLSMVYAAIGVADEMQGFKLAYVQSDEASFLLTDYDRLESEPWFGYVQSKVETISASLMSVIFNYSMHMRTNGHFDAVFDARAFNIPEDEVANYFLWRAKDWRRNSISMMCSAYFSPEQLHGKSIEERLQMLKEAGHPWEALNLRTKYGTFFADEWEDTYLEPTYENISTYIKEQLS